LISDSLKNWRGMKNLMGDASRERWISSDSIKYLSSDEVDSWKKSIWLPCI
jgi:hypothetical protein